MTYPLPTNINSSNHAGLTADDHESFHDTVHSTANYSRYGTGDPDGSVEANAGTVYYDTNGKLWLKQTGASVSGWVEMVPANLVGASVVLVTDGDTNAGDALGMVDNAGGDAVYMRVANGVFEILNGDFSTVLFKVWTSGDIEPAARVISERTGETSASTYTIIPSENILNVNTSSNACTITLESCASAQGHSFIIRRDGTNSVTINRAGSDTFDDGDTQKVLADDGAAIGLFSVGGTEWKIMATEGTVTGS